MGWHGTMWGDVEMWGDVGTWGEYRVMGGHGVMWGCGVMWGGMGRCGVIWGHRDQPGAHLSPLLRLRGVAAAAVGLLQVHHICRDTGCHTCVHKALHASTRVCFPCDSVCVPGKGSLASPSCPMM